MESEESVFIKQSEIPKTKCKLSYDSIIENIPEPHFKSRIPANKDLIEWRWRFYNINNKKIVEISYYNPKTNERTYINSKGEYVKRDIPKELEVFIIEEYYYYTN